MSRNEEFSVGMAHIIAQNHWDPNMGSPEELLDREGPYVSKLAASEARNRPITLKKRDDGSTVVWDGHHRLAAKMFFDSTGKRRKEPSTSAMVRYRWEQS